MTHELDPRLYGVAPVLADAHDNSVLWTMAQVLRYVGISETTLRLTPELMRLRRVIRPRVYRWIPDEVRAYVANLPKGPTPLAITRALRVDRQKVKAQRKMRRTRKDWQREYDAKLKALDTELLREG